ncbi:choice-of-anchor D domain-containing protein [Actinokineospora sp. NPDC004072]
MRAARSAAVRRGALGLVVVAGAALVTWAPAGTAAVAPGDTGLVTRSTEATLPGSQAVETAISGNGRHIVFASRGSYTDLDNDFAVNVFARDLTTGVTTQISVAYAEGEPVSPDGDSSQPAISADGRYVAFVTSATNLTGDDNAPDLVVADRDEDGNGTLDDSPIAFARVSESDIYTGKPRTPRIAADGSRVLWTDEEPYSEFGYTWVVRARDLAGGAPTSPIREVAADPDPTDDFFPVGAYDGALSADGAYAAMTVDFYERIDTGIGLRRAPLLRLGGAAQAVPSPDFTGIVLVRLGAPGVADEVSRVDFDADGDYLGVGREVGVRSPALSGDGSVVAFEAQAYETSTDGSWRPAADQPNVYLHLRGEERSQIVSLDNAGQQRNGARPALSADGRYLAFVTDSLNMHDGIDWGAGDSSCLHESESRDVPPPDDERDRRTYCQVVVRDLVLDEFRETTGAARLPGLLASPGIDPFCAESLPPGETCAGNDDSGLSASWSVLDFGDGEGVPSLSADGGRVAFDSASEALTEDDLAAETREWDGFVRTFLPTLVADPIDFGEAEVGAVRDRTATLRVVGSGPLTVESIAVDGADFAPGADTCVGVRLHRDDSCLTGVRFTPTTPGGKAGSLVVRLTDGREFTVPLRGSGSEIPVVPDGPELAAAPDPVAFGPRLLLSTDPTATVTITNAGGSPLTFPAPPTAAGDFSVRSTDCAEVAPGASCRVVVQFRPTQPGARTGVLQVPSNAPGGPRLVALSGAGSQPVIKVNPGVSRPGRVIGVSGTGFPAHVPVTVGYLESVETATVVTSNEGTFSVALLVFPKASIGSRTVAATVAGVAPEFIEPGRLLVVYPSMSPPEFLTRG